MSVGDDLKLAHRALAQAVGKIAGSWFRAIEASILDTDREQIIEALDEAGNADMHAADAAWEARA